MNDREKPKSSGGGGGKSLHDFDYTLPRPPALGEERVYGTTEWGVSAHHYSQKSTSPIPKLNYDKTQMSPPACFAWAQSLHNLLQDPDGVKLFLRYLESEGPQHADTLRFWFACEGLKNHNQVENIHRLVKLIYKTYFMKSALPINDELRKQVIKNMKSQQCLEPPITLFDEAQAQIEYLINKTTYPNFLESDMYLQYLQTVENPSSGSDDYNSESSSSSSSVSNRELGNLTACVGPLPTLHEDMEFHVNHQPPLLLTPGTASVSTGYHTPTVRLTKDMLLRSQKHRALDKSKSETYAGLIYRSNGAHVVYNSYNPVSRQDSEMQSLSSHSDAKTESDNRSLNEKAVDGRTSGRSRHKSIEDKLAERNKETNMNVSIIPRTQRTDLANKELMDLANKQEWKKHAALLTEKLEILKRDQENEELFHRRLKEGESVSDKKIGNRDLETAMRAKLQFQDDNDQNILDEHVSRVFSDHSLSISPDLASPKPTSPPRVRWVQSGRNRRREKDLFSTFSGDSGNVHDFADGASDHKTMTKSKSMPEYGEERFTRGTSGRRSTTKKTPTDLIDSGVSMVSDSASTGTIQVTRDSRVATWLMESDRSSGRIGGGHAQSEMAVREGVGRKYGRRHGSRSNSLERNSVAGPAQPFIADPSMPPLPLPNTDIQLEEIRRRLTEDDGKRSRQRPFTQSSQSTLKKSTRGQRPNFAQTEDITTVVFSFCDEQFPYRTKIPGSQITLKQFKDFLPKKGNYRFFFKTVCEDLSNQVTHEEVSNDNEVLPLWEGKIMAQVKPVD